MSLSLYSLLGSYTYDRILKYKAREKDYCYCTYFFYLIKFCLIFSRFSTSAEGLCFFVLESSKYYLSYCRWMACFYRSLCIWAIASRWYTMNFWSHIAVKASNSFRFYYSICTSSRACLSTSECLRPVSAFSLICTIRSSYISAWLKSPCLSLINLCAFSVCKWNCTSLMLGACS